MTNKTRNMKSLISPTILAFISASSIQAATISGVTIEDVSSQLNTSSFDRLADYTLNGSGFQAGVPSTHSELQESVSWLSHGTFNGATDTLPTVITFDLEANYNLNSFTVWNYNEINFTSRGANNVEILVASSVGGSFTSLGNFTFAQAPGNSTTAFGEDFALSAAAADDTRLVRFNITTNHGAGFDFAGLSEIRFDGEAVPEPSSFALLGLAGLALLARRRK